MPRSGKGLSVAGGYTNNLTSGNGSLEHSDTHSCIKRQADETMAGKVSPQASIQKALWLLAAAAAVTAAPLVYRSP